MNNVAGFLSGGGTKLIAILSAFLSLLVKRKVKFKVLGGVSAGAIILWLYIGGYTSLFKGIKIALNIKIKTFLSNNPYGLKGWGRVLLGIFKDLLKIKGKEINYLAKMTNLKKLMKKLIDEKTFNKYIRDNNTPDLFVLAISKKGVKTIWNLKDLEYDKAINVVLASSSIAPAVEAITIDGIKYYDGGHRDHSPGSYILNKIGHKYNLNKVITIYSRPEDTSELAENPDTATFVKLLFNFTLPVANLEITENDEKEEQKWCNTHNAQYVPIFIKRFTKDVYDVNKIRLKLGEKYGEEAVDEYYR